MRVEDINWMDAKAAHGGGDCTGLSGDTIVVDDNDDTVLDCHESGEPVDRWCSGCIGWVAVCELAAWQAMAGKEKPCES